MPMRTNLLRSNSDLPCIVEVNYPYFHDRPLWRLGYALTLERDGFLSIYDVGSGTIQLAPHGCVFKKRSPSELEIRNFITWRMTTD